MDDLQHLGQRLSDVLEERKRLHINDPAVYRYWELLSKILAENIPLSISYLKQCSEEYLELLSEVFEDVMELTNNIEYLAYLKDLKDQSVNELITSNAKEAMDYYRSE
ncbi:MAG: hypothetical protein MI810_23515 [Flavobacteriales bacterium]|jgi:hypothetical protein|nr:hypothetical protein [Flavobacteriales bacterium]